MNITGMKHGARLLRHVGFQCPEVLDGDVDVGELRAMLERHGEVFVKPSFRGGVGKKGKAGLVGRARTVAQATAEKERLYFAVHCVGQTQAKANGVTFEAAVKAEHEIYFSLTDSTIFRAPTMTLTHLGGVDIEDLDPRHVAQVPFDPLTGLKAFVVANALCQIGAPREVISPLVQELPKLWDLFHDYGMTTLELNPIRMTPGRGGKLVPVACDFKCSFDRDDSRWLRLGLAPEVFAVDHSDFEQEINALRTHQGQSDVHIVNPQGTILAPTFGGGANSLVTELLSDAAIISTDFGGNPPYEKMKDVMRICLAHWRRQSNVLLVIGGKSNNTDIHETFRAIADALREDYAQTGPTPLYVIAGRGGPRLVQGMSALRDACEALGLPYRLFGFDSDMSEVIAYARQADVWMQGEGRTRVASVMHGAAPADAADGAIE